MLKTIVIEYEEANGKYYVYSNGVFIGKWYTLKNCLESLLKELE